MGGTNKFVHDDVLDLQLDGIGSTKGDKLFVCSSFPTNYTEASSTFKLADQAMVGGDYTKGDDPTSGRRLTVASKSAVPIDTSGTATHIAICDSVATKVLLVLTLSASQPLVAPNTVTTPVLTHTSNDPT